MMNFINYILKKIKGTKQMKTSSAGINLIKEFESFRASPYVCPGGHNTIGYGNTMYNDGTKVKLSDPDITEEEATKMLRHQVARDYEKCVIKNAIKPNTQNQFDAMVSFTYNLGCGNFSRSTLLKKHLKGDFDGAAKEFLKWNKAGGQVLAGLTRRRKAEKTLYEKPLRKF